MCLQSSRTAPQMGGLLAVGRITSFESTADQAVVRGAAQVGRSA